MMPIILKMSIMPEILIMSEMPKILIINFAKGASRTGGENEEMRK